MPAGKTSPAPASKVADVKTPDAVAQPPAQPAIPQQIPPPQVLPQQAVPTCNKSVGTGVAVGGILQTIGGFVSGDYLKGTGGIINTIAGSQMNKNC